MSENSSYDWMKGRIPCQTFLHSLKRSLVDQALDQLRLRITEGVWTVGQRLPTEPELSAELGISRNTVREAMRVLAFSGLIEIRQGDGSYLRAVVDPLDTMKALSRCSHEQARETRHILEVEAIGLAALRRTDEDLVALREALGVSGSHYHGDLDTLHRLRSGVPPPSGGRRAQPDAQRAVSLFLQRHRCAVARDPEHFPSTPRGVRPSYRTA